MLDSSTASRRASSYIVEIISLMEIIVFNFRLQSKCLLHTVHWNPYINKTKTLSPISEESQIGT